MNSVFRTFLSKSGVPLICKALTYQGFFLLLCKCMYSKTLRMRNVYFYARSLFEHGFLTNSRDKRLQRLAESCISKFCEGVPHCKIEHTAPHFCESFWRILIYSLLWQNHQAYNRIGGIHICPFSLRKSSCIISAVFESS